MYILTLVKNVPLSPSFLFNLFNTHLKLDVEFWNEDHGEGYAKVARCTHAHWVISVQFI